MEEGMNMALKEYWFDEWSDIFYFAIAPIYTPFQLWNVGVGYASDGFYPLGKPDYRDTVRDSTIWAAIVASVYGYNSFVHPGKYEFLTATKAFEVLAKFVPWNAVAVGTLAAAPAGLYMANKAVIESAPQHEQPSLWQSFAQAITGTGTGIGGYRGHVE